MYIDSWKHNRKIKIQRQNDLWQNINSRSIILLIMCEEPLKPRLFHTTVEH